MGGAFGLLSCQAIRRSKPKTETTQNQPRFAFGKPFHVNCVVTNASNATDFNRGVRSIGLA